MKNLAFIIILLVATTGLNSCENYFDDVNVNPNEPFEVTEKVLLPTIQVALAYVYAGDLSRLTSVYSQHVDGSTREFERIQEYEIFPSDLNTLWENVYNFILPDIIELEKVSTANQSVQFAGIAKVLKAYALLVLASHFNDVPYSQAAQGTAQLQPDYDSQQSIYNEIQNLLTNAQTNFDSPPAVIVPGNEDLIFRGNIDRWVRFKNALAARAYLHLADMNSANYQTALNQLAMGGLTSLADNSKVEFFTTSGESNPWYQYNEQRQDIMVGDSYVALLQSLNDPREAWYGVTLNQNHPYFTRNRPVLLFSYTEQKFIEAECRMRTEGATAATHQAYLDAVAASFDHLGLSADYAAYVGQAAVDPGQANMTMNEIMTQKYIAMFTDPEVFADWRRTGIPSLTPNTGVEIPRRLPYPQNEIDLNPNTPNVTIFESVWWDM